MQIVRHRAHPARLAPTLVIMLPGALQRPEEFVANGIVAAIGARALALDLTVADLSFDVAAGVTAATRIEHELVQPARADGYRRVWLAGISIGGLLALGHADRFPGQLDGLCLLAPYPGNRMVTNEIRAAGGLRGWRGGGGASEADDERRAWRFLQQAGDGDAPRIFLGYGDDDRFAPAHRMMADALPPDRVATVSGPHDWRAWRPLWDIFLDRHAGILGRPA